MITKERIKILAHEVGFDACGVTLPRPIPEAEEAFRNWSCEGKHGEMKYLEDYEVRRNRFWNSFRHAKSIVVLGINYFSRSTVPVLEGTHFYSSNIEQNLSLREPEPNGKLKGRIARYAWGKDYHKVISKRLELLKGKIKEEAGREVCFELAVDTKPLLERTLGEQAGLGFIGKQTQLLSLQFGPWLFLSELITDLELEPDEPFSGSCGTCRLCIDECPTGAIEETGSIDARKCVAYLTIEHKTEIPVELRPKIGNWVFGCDECLNVCPYTAKQKEGSWDELKAGAGFGKELDLLKLFEIKSNGEYQKRFGQSAVSRANRKQLLRNACIVLGNSGSQAALATLQKALDDPSLLVREHAHWAIDRKSVV